MSSLRQIKPNSQLLIVAGILLAGLVIRLYGLRWGLPSVYEEAIPLKTAWGMYNWERPAGVNLNPHFFNYPSLMIYVHFALQGLLYGLMKLGGVIDTSIDYQVRYLVDPTSWYIAGRLVSTLFGLGTILFSFLIGRKLSGVLTGLLAALFMSLNTFHAERSQMIEVDVPLVFGVSFALWATLRLMGAPNIKNYLLAGLAIGTAAATKYTGAMLILPLVAAHYLARKKAVASGIGTPPIVLPIICLLVTALVFVVTSPYVLLDFKAFQHDFSLEQVHMKIGHFGLGDESSPVFYTKALGNDLLGWPVSLLGLAGFVFFVFVKRQHCALILAAFAVPYALAVSTWEMHANRYLLPVLPVIILFAAALIEYLLALLQQKKMSQYLRPGLVVLVGLIVAVPAVAVHVKRVQALQLDPRTHAREWIESNIPSGSYIVTEAYGPELFPAGSILQVQPEARDKLLAALAGRPIYPVHVMQMYQGRAERSAVYYDIKLYENADFFITSSAVRSRYEREPERFRDQMAFYKKLDDEFIKIREFRKTGGSGPTQAIYKNPAYNTPYGRRSTALPPRRIAHRGGMLTGGEGKFYFNVGLNYEIYSHYSEAVQSYELALDHTGAPGLFTVLVMRKTSCLLKMRKFPEVLEFLRYAIANAPDEASRLQFTDMRASVIAVTERSDR